MHFVTLLAAGRAKSVTKIVAYTPIFWGIYHFLVHVSFPVNCYLPIWAKWHLQFVRVCFVEFGSSRAQTVVANTEGLQGLHFLSELYFKKLLYIN